MPENKDSAFVTDDNIYNKKIKSVPKPETSIGIDTKDTVINKVSNITEQGVVGSLDLSSIEGFTRISQRRDQIYSLLDTMAEDPIVSAVLETYAEDATEYNDEGKIVWAESSDANVAKYVTFLLDTMNVDKNVYKWVYSLCKYGDVYFKLFRESDYKDDVLGDMVSGEKENERTMLNESTSSLQEDVNIIAHSKNDKFAHYIEMIPNPAEMFELTRFGKTYAYIQADLATSVNVSNNDSLTNSYSYINYKFKKSDVNVHGPMDYVHASLEDNSSRTPEEVTLFIEKDESQADSTEKSTTYTVKRGQSLLYSAFKAWRELTLLENSVLLNRLTKSAIVRMMNVEVGDMPKEMVGPHLQNIKSLIEQKSAINTGKSMSEYTNPGPVENTIYIPTRNGIGAISTEQIGGDVNIGQLTDLDYFKNKYYGAMRVPKQYFGDTDDSTGFNGGTSLSIISSRYAKVIKRIQNAICQAMTDVVNLMLIDKGMDNYVNDFTIKMLPPTTQEEIDRRENISSKVQVTRDIMDLVADVEDPVIKLKILKELLSTITNGDVIELLQDQITKMEEESESTSSGEIPNAEGEEEGFDTSEPMDLGSDLGLTRIGGEESESSSESAEGETPEGTEEEGEEALPTPEDLGVDMTNNDTGEE